MSDSKEDPKEDKEMPVLEVPEDPRNYDSCPEGHSHGHTPGSAEGEDPDAPQSDAGCSDPGKTPGNAEG